MILRSWRIVFKKLEVALIVKFFVDSTRKMQALYTICDFSNISHVLSAELRRIINDTAKHIS